MASKHLTLEQQNFVRLSLAGVDEARVVLGYVLHSQIPPEDLVKKIQANKAILLKGNYKLSPEQQKLCCIPGSGVPDYKTFDITLLYRLIRNLCSSLQPSQGWSKEPRPTEINIGDDIERLRIFRNEMIAHVKSSGVPDKMFNSKWTELEYIFKRIQGFLQKKGHAEDLEGGLKSIKSTLFGWDDYDRCQVRLMWEHLNERKTAPELTLEGGERKICGESACFVIKFGDGEMSISWPITWQRIKGNITEKLDTSAERYRGSYSQRLVIAKVAKEDEGQYQAAVSREEKGTHIQVPSNTVYLTVTGDVPILDMENAVSEDDSITIYYKMSTNDESPDVERVVWSKDGKPLVKNADKYSGGSLNHTYLTIHSPTSTDMGQYSCEVFNAVGSIKKTINLNFPLASINDKPTTKVGDPVTITATIRSSPKLLSAKWQKSLDGAIGNFTDVDINDRKYFGSTADREDPKLCIPKTTREDGILYRLVVSNGLGQCESNTVFLKLVDVPSVFVNHETRVSEQSVKLVCIISLYQQSPEVSRVLWTKDGLEIDILGSGGKYTGGSIADPSLTINEVNRNDNGKYQCCVSNSVGDKWSESILLGILSDSGLVYVATRLGAEWELVVVSLGLKKAEIDQIKLDNPYSTHTQINTALRKWRDRRGDQTDNTLLQQLFRALGTCDRTDLVEEIQQKYNIQEDRDLTESESESEDRPGDEEKKSGDIKLAQTGEDGMKEDRDLTESESESEDRLGDEQKESGDTKLAQAGEDGMKGGETYVFRNVKNLQLGNNNVIVDNSGRRRRKHGRRRKQADSSSDSSYSD